MFTSVGQGLIPYGAQLLTAAALTGLTPFDFMPYKDQLKTKAAQFLPVLLLLRESCF